jgi:hypothetical protein
MNISETLHDFDQVFGKAKKATLVAASAAALLSNAGCGNGKYNTAWASVSATCGHYLVSGSAAAAKSYCKCMESNISAYIAAHSGTTAQNASNLAAYNKCMGKVASGNDNPTY